MNFELNDDQQAYIASAKAFSDNELAPHAAHWDAESVFAKEALKAAGELGFMGMYTPEAAGKEKMKREMLNLLLKVLVQELALRRNMFHKTLAIIYQRQNPLNPQPLRLIL